MYFLNKKNMIFKYVSQEKTIAKGLDIEDNFDIAEGATKMRFNIAISQLAIDPELLTALRFFSDYAESYRRRQYTKQDAISFFIAYFDAFNPGNPRSLPGDTLQILITSQDLKQKLSGIFNKRIEQTGNFLLPD